MGEGGSAQGPIIRALTPLPFPRAPPPRPNHLPKAPPPVPIAGGLPRWTCRGTQSSSLQPPRPPATNPRAVWSPAVGQHRGPTGKRLLGRGGEGRQAPAGGHPSRRRGLGAEPGLPGLHGEPPAGSVPARSLLLGQPAAQRPPRPSKAGAAGPGVCLLCESLSSPPPPESLPRRRRRQERAGRRTRPRTQGAGPRGLWGASGGTRHPFDPDS